MDTSSNAANRAPASARPKMTTTMTTMTTMRTMMRTMVTMMTSIIGLPRESDQRRFLILRSCFTVLASRMSLAFWNLKDLTLHQIKQKMIVHHSVVVAALLLLKLQCVVDRWHMTGCMIQNIPPIPSSDHTQRHLSFWSARSHVEPCLSR